MVLNDRIIVLLPLYKGDRPDYFRLALDSILQQTCRQVEVYIGVDGPVKSEICSCLKEIENDPAVHIFYYQENRGLAVVLNDLLEVCFQEEVEYIARMDADDISCPDRLEKQLYFLKTHPEIDVVGGAITEMDEQGNVLKKTIHYPLTHTDCYRFFRGRNPLAHPAVLFRKRFFDKAGKYRKEYRQNQDTLLWFDGFRRGCLFANLPDVVLHFRMTNNLFKKRRNGYAFAKQSLRDRFMINRGLGYGIYANLFAIMMFLITVSPVWVKKIAYRLR